MRERSYGEDLTPAEGQADSPLAAGRGTFQEADLLAVAEAEEFHFGDRPGGGGGFATPLQVPMPAESTPEDAATAPQSPLNPVLAPVVGQGRAGTDAKPQTQAVPEPPAGRRISIDNGAVAARVSFHAPLVLKPESATTVSTFDGTVLNLSKDGIACVAPLELNIGERVWVNFRLGLGERPLTFLAEVIWRCYPADDKPRAEQNQDVRYGLRFRSLTRQESRKLDSVVRERTQGRAGAWPLPVLDGGTEAAADAEIDGNILAQDSAAAAEASAEPVGDSRAIRATRSAAQVVAELWAGWRFGRVMAIGCGVAVGVGLALAVALDHGAEVENSATAAVVDFGAVPLADDITEEIDAVLAADEPVGASTGVTANVLETKLATAGDAALRPRTAAFRPTAAPASAVPSAPLPAPAVDNSTSQGSSVSKSSATALLPRKGGERPAPPRDMLRPGGTDTMALALLADGDVGQHKAFWLDNPRRLVIDIPNRKNGFARSDYAIVHPLATRLRIGNHRDHVRFVLETSERVRKDIKVQAKGTALAVVISRR